MSRHNGLIYGVCIECGAVLEADDVGATKKLMNRGANVFFCIPCLARHYEIEEAALRRKIEEYRAYGCHLFPKKQ